MMITSTSALAITGLLGAAALAMPSLAAQIKAAETSVLAKEASVLAKKEASVLAQDRPDVRPIAGSCSQQVWPNFDASCLRSHGPVVLVREVHLVTARR